MRVVTTYGSAETCGGCVYDGFPLEDVLVRVDGRRPHPAGRGNHRRRLPGGPGTHAQRRSCEDDGVRWYRTNDLGELDADGKLTVLGRADDVVITGGVKVSAAHVQAELEKLDGVRAAFVAGVPSAEWGQALAAYVALADSSPEGIAGLHRRAPPGRRRWARWPRKPCWPPGNC